MLDRLQRDTGVVVQGPPGTGKTHTIANLLSALLAQGQRVLAPAPRPRPDRAARKRRRPSATRCVLRRARGARRTARANSPRTVYARSAPGYSGTLAAIVRQVQDAAPALSWIGSLSDHAPSAPPLTALEAEELLVLLREGTADLAAGPLPPSPATLPTPGQVATAVADESPDTGLPDEAADLRNRLTALDTPTTDHLVELLASGRALLHRIGAPWEAARWGGAEWSRRALADRLARRRSDLWDRVAEAGTALAAVADGLARAGVRTVVLPETLTAEQASLIGAAVPELRAHLAGRRGLRGLIVPKAQRQVRELLDTCRVDGRPPADAADLDAVHAHLQAHRTLATIAVRWAQVDAPLEDGPLEVRLATLRERYRHLESVAAFGGLRERVDDLLVGRGVYLDLTTPRQWDHFTSAVSALAGRQRAEDAAARLTVWERSLRGGSESHPRPPSRWPWPRPSPTGTSTATARNSTPTRRPTPGSGRHGAARNC